MIQPVRIQRKRSKGFKLQEVSKSINGLPAKSCTRPGKWGNPFKVGKSYNIIELPTNVKVYSDDNMLTIYRPSHAVEIHMKYLRDQIKAGKLNLDELKGHNLACFCKTDDWCHVDNILELLNTNP